MSKEKTFPAWYEVKVMRFPSQHTKHYDYKPALIGVSVVHKNGKEAFALFSAADVFAEAEARSNGKHHYPSDDDGKLFTIYADMPDDVLEYLIEHYIDMTDLSDEEIEKYLRKHTYYMSEVVGKNALSNAEKFFAWSVEDAKRKAKKQQSRYGTIIHLGGNADDVDEKGRLARWFAYCDDNGWHDCDYAIDNDFIY